MGLSLTSPCACLTSLRREMEVEVLRCCVLCLGGDLEILLWKDGPRRGRVIVATREDWAHHSGRRPFDICCCLEIVSSTKNRYRKFPLARTFPTLDFPQKAFQAASIYFGGPIRPVTRSECLINSGTFS